MELYKNYARLNNDRIDFSKVSGKMPLPYLVEIQTDSFKWFIDQGLSEAFSEVFPIISYDKRTVIDFISCFLEEPKYSPLECKSRNLSYSSTLKAVIRISKTETKDTKESTVVIGDLPMMTDSGTFVINGGEKVIVSQIVRSPGAYLRKSRDKYGRFIYNADLIPGRGTWLEFESDIKGLLSVRVDRQRKMPVTVFLKALGFTKYEDIEALFGESKSLKDTWDKDTVKCNTLDALKEIFNKLKPGEPITEEGLYEFLKQKFFDDKRYDIGAPGRYKFNKKLGPYNRLIGRYLAQNIVDENGEILFPKKHLMSKEDVSVLKKTKIFENGAYALDLDLETRLDTNTRVHQIKVYNDDSFKKVCYIVANDANSNLHRVTISDMVATFSYFINIMDGFGETDDIDNLSNRRIRRIGELLQTQFRIGLTKMSKAVVQKLSISNEDDLSLQSLLNVRLVSGSIKDFFNSSQLSQFMDQTNPLAELTNKRRISALGPGGLTRDRASIEVRDVHFTHYGRICPIETPEGQNIGLINNLATYARVNKYGFIETPYRKVIHKQVDGVDHAYVSEETTYFSADQERNHKIAQANVKISSEGEILQDGVVARYNGENLIVKTSEVEYIDVSPKQIISVATACIPFLENDDNTRALMGANMQRQALPLLNPETPLVGTGMEYPVAHDSGLAVIAKNDGVVIYKDSKKIIIKNVAGTLDTYILQKFERSNNGTCINQTPIVAVNQSIKKGQIIADGPSMDHGDLALGKNVVVAFTTWEGYNFEDAVIMSQRLVKDDVYTSIHIESYDLECRETKLGPETITRDIPNTSENAKKFLDERGIITIGSEVKEGDILVGKTTPKGQGEPLPEEKIFMAIFGDKSKDGKDSSLRVPHGGNGIVVDVKCFSRKNGDELPTNVNEKIRVYIAQRRKISEGDKMSGRHGNKGVISRILPVEDMPYLPDGTPVDIMLNPCGVPSRMNIGQILELHLGLACKKLGIKIATPVFDGISNDEIFDLIRKAGLSEDGKTVLYDGRTGERFDEKISVGVMYMIKLVHMVDDKLHARATGPYSLVTQQPLGGKAQNGGQKFGEMEVWALEAYGAAYTLQEILTIKSDDRAGKRKTYSAIIKGTAFPKPSIPEACRVFIKELKGLALDITLFDSNNKEIDMDVLAKETSKEERSAEKSIRTARSMSEEEEEKTFTSEEAEEMIG